MKAEITFNQLWCNPSVRGFFFRTQSENTLNDLIERAGNATDVCKAVDDYAERTGEDLDEIEEYFYNDSVEELAERFEIELEDSEDE